MKMISKPEASYVGQSREKDKCSACSMFRKPDACTLVEGAIAPDGWCKFFKAAKPLGKATSMSGDFNVFMPISKVDKDTRTVSGYASTPTKDSDGEIITLEAIKNALPDYMAYGNIREMHKLNAVGVAQEANIDTKGLFLTAKIIDDGAWEKCLEGVYKGFSIGGKKLDKVGNKVTELEMTEISVVDRPANPDCRITLAKSAKTVGDAAGYLLKVKAKLTPEKKALVKMAKVVGDLAKAGPKAARDGFSLPAPKLAPQPDGTASVNDSRPNENVTRKTDDGAAPCEKHGKAACALCAVEKTQEIAARAKTSKKEAKKLAKMRAERAFALNGQDFLVLGKSLETVDDDDDTSVNKGMGSAGSLAYCFDSIRNVQRSLLMEGKREGGDSKDKELAKQLGAIAKQLAAVIGQKAEHEGGEAETLTDADDQYLPSLLGEGFNKMNTQVETDGENGEEVLAKTGDPLVDAINALVKRAGMPTRKARMEMAGDNVKKSRQCMKAARGAIEEAHKMHKAAYLAKAAKKDDKDDGEFDHAGAMEKLQKAYQELNKARTFNKAVAVQLEKMAHSGQRGQEAGDGEAGVYEVPPGVRDLSDSIMSTASPGGEGRGSVPPAYPVDGSVYPGKAAGVGNLAKYAKNGQISAVVAELLLEKAQAEGELAAFKRLPAAAVNGRRQPYSFDLTKVSGGSGNTGGDQATLNKALFEGVNVAALASGEEHLHTTESAKVIGNFLTSGLFGKTVFDPAFKGAAGNAR